MAKNFWPRRELRALKTYIAPPFCGKYQVISTLNNFFKSAVNSLDIRENTFLLTDSNHLIDPVENTKNQDQFKVQRWLHLISNCLKSNKAGAYKNIPDKRIKQTLDICCKSLMKVWKTKTEVVTSK